MDALAAHFPLTLPIPTPYSLPALLTTADLTREEDILRNPHSFRAWWSAIHSVRDAHLRSSPSTHPILGPLSDPQSRLALQRLVYLYESALVHFPTSFKLWKSYLSTRQAFVCGLPLHKKRAGGRKKLQNMKDALDDEKDDIEQWSGSLDPIIGWQEWRALVATFERALMWLPKFPRLWLMYFSLFTHPFCPAPLAHTHARRTFDRALRTLPPSLHHRIWSRFLLWAESRGGPTAVSVYRRYLAVDPSITERFAAFLLHPPTGHPRPLEAAKLLLGLARSAARGDYVSPEGKSAYQLLGEWIDVVEQYPDQVGVDVQEEEDHEQGQEDEVKEDVTEQKTQGSPPQPDKPAYDQDEDPMSSQKLPVERIIRKDGLGVYKDQAGRLWTGLATYWIKRGEFARAKATFESGIRTVLTIRDFTQIFDAYAEFGESLVSALMQSLEDEEDETEEEAAETEKELDDRMKEFEDLTDRRPFLVNDVLIRRNPNDVQEWEKRVALWGEDDDRVAETYTKALETIHSRKATANLHRLYINFAKFYEEGGTANKAVSDLDSARKILEKGTKINFKLVEDLAEVWCEWSEMEIRHENYDDAIRVMQRATAIPKNPKINYHDHSLPAQARLFKSLKLWSFYVDLEESIGTVESTKAVYDKILELRIANAQIIVNYAAFLEENQYFEESFKVYERGVELFTFPISLEIWNIYLSKFVKRYGGTKLERSRDLFEQALEKCPAKSCKPFFLMYAKLEEDYGLAKRAMSIYERATQVVQDEDKFDMFTVYIAKATANYGLPATRSIYELLPDRQTAEMCLRFAALERKLGEIDRARAIYAHASQFCDPRTNPRFWSEWNTFEIETGSEDTFRDMLRIKRSVQAQFNTETSYLVAEAAAARQGTAAVAASLAPQDAMALADDEQQQQQQQQQTSAKGPAFVAAKKQQPALDGEQLENGDVDQTLASNVDEIHISDDDL